MSFRYGVRIEDVRQVVVNSEGAVGWFDSRGKYHVDPARAEAVRNLEIAAPDISEMREVVNLDKSIPEPMVWVELAERDWFN